MWTVEYLTDVFYRDRPGWQDGTEHYRILVERCVADEDRVLDIGPGDGSGFSHRLKGRVSEVVGIDPDQGVSGNEELDRGIVGCVEDMPFPDAHFDVIVSNYALEHIEDPEAGALEIYRVLKPGGRFVFRTPNVWHYVGLISWITPHWFHELVANWARKVDEEAGDPYPTFYRCNSLRRIRRVFGKAGFHVDILRGLEAEPSYLQFNRLAFLLGVAYERVVNASKMFSNFRANIIGVFQKQPDA